jgi:hypothetical protein
MVNVFTSLLFAATWSISGFFFLWRVFFLLWLMKAYIPHDTLYIYPCVYPGRGIMGECVHIVAGRCRAYADLVVANRMKKCVNEWKDWLCVWKGSEMRWLCIVDNVGLFAGTIIQKYGLSKKKVGDRRRKRNVFPLKMNSTFFLF